MARRRGDGHRLVRWLWTSPRGGAGLARAALVPLSGLWRAAVASRNWAFDHGWIATRDLPLPAVAVGNLTVGGSGKTPIAGWIARHYLERGVKPGVLLRGHGRDEVLLHQRHAPEAAVVANPDRVAGAEVAMAAGAQVLVLDDAYQRRDVGRDLNLLVMSAESAHAVRWCLPAGPWREPLTAAARADAVIITRKRADLAAAQATAAELRRLVQGPVGIVHLNVAQYVGLVSGTVIEASRLAGRRVLAASAIADPAAFVAQTKATGAQVQVATWRDHHEFEDEDVAWLAQAARKVDWVVLTEKDAVKLEDRWPAKIPEPVVARLVLTWDAGVADIQNRLDALVTHRQP